MRECQVRGNQETGEGETKRWEMMLRTDKVTGEPRAREQSQAWGIGGVRED